MGKLGYKITLTEEAYRNLKLVKERLGAKSWEELSRKLLELVGSGAGQSGVPHPTAEQRAPPRGTLEQSRTGHSTPQRRLETARG